MTVADAPVDPMLSVTATSAHLGVSRLTVLHLVRRGELRATKTSSNGHWRIRRSWIEEFIEKGGNRH